MTKISNKHTQINKDNYALIPAEIHVAKSKQLKDGWKYLIFVEPIGATSKEMPSLGVVTAKTDKEAIQKAQEILNENLAWFLRT